MNSCLFYNISSAHTVLTLACCTAIRYWEWQILVHLPHRSGFHHCRLSYDKVFSVSQAANNCTFTCLEERKYILVSWGHFIE